MNSPYYYKYLRSEFADKEMHDLSYSFMDYFYSTTVHDEKSEKFQAELLRRAGAVISKYLAPIHIKKISTELILKLYATSNFKVGEAQILAKFLFFMIDNNIIHSATIKRLTIFRKRLEYRASAEDFYRILNCKRFEEFLYDDYFSTAVGITSFFLTIPKDGFIDETLYETLLDSLDEMKLNKDYTYSLRKAACYTYIYIAKTFFANIRLCDITLNHINNCLKKLQNESIPVRCLLTLSETLLYLNSKNLIVDKGALHLLSLKDLLLSSTCTFDKYLELTSDKNIKQFILVKNSSDSPVFLLYINIKCKEVFDAWVNFCNGYSKKNTIQLRTICNEFDDSLFGFTINSLEDINFNTFCAQILYFGKYKNKNYTSPITAFYLFLSQNYNPKLFETSGFDIKLLQRTMIAEELLEGYKIINYNPYENVPEEDKWLLSYNDIQETNTDISTTTSRITNFSAIKSNTFKNWVKHFIWNASGSISFKLDSAYILVEFTNYIYNLKQGTELSIYTRKTSNEAISPNEALAYKTYILNKSFGNNAKYKRILLARLLLKHVECSSLSQIDSRIWYILKFIRGKTTNNAEAILDNDLSRLVKLMKANAEKSIRNKVYFSILCLLIETEFRSSQIRALTIDCIQETAKRNQYVLVSTTKTSNGQPLEQPITLQTKRLLDDVIKSTSEYRRNCTVDGLKNQVFLLEAKKKGAYKIVSRTEFSRYLTKCCKELGLKGYSSENLRDTHMTKVKEYTIKNKMSDMEQSVLSGHISPDSDKCYEDIDIRVLLESIHGIIIGNVDIKGKILKEAPMDIATTENTVSNGCGYCGLKTCNDTSYFDCLMCSDFIATLNRIPFFEDQIKIISKKIESTTIRHDKEDLVNIKRLLVEYLRKLLILKKEETLNERSSN